MGKMKRYGFPIQAFGNDRSEVIPRMLGIVVRNDEKRDSESSSE